MASIRKAGRIGLSFDGLDEMIATFSKIEKDDALKKTVEKALDASADIVYKAIKEAMAKATVNGKPVNWDRTGRTAASLEEKYLTVWETSTQAYKPVGFNFKVGGLPSVFLMHGTPRMKPNRALWEAVYGKKINEQISETQKMIFQEELNKILSGGG